MKNKLEDLNNHLFEQLERLNDDDLTGEKLVEELDRAKGMSDIAQQIISNANVTLKAYELAGERGYAAKPPTLLLGRSE